MSAVCGWIRITIAGRDHEMVALAEGARLSDLYRQLEQRFPKLGSLRNSIALALNQEYSNAAAELHDNDEVALIPPVSGGSKDEDSTWRKLPLR